MKRYEERFMTEGKEDLIITKDSPRDTIFPFHPDDFIRYTKQMEMMTTSDLRKFIKEEEVKGLATADKYLIELYRRSSDPFTIIILTIMGVSIASRKVRGGLGLHLAMGVSLGAIYVILSKFSVTFVTNVGFLPFLGVWIPNIVFSLVAIYLYKIAQK
jgi:lipopolysaccharide export system permease protein